MSNSSIKSEQADFELVPGPAPVIVVQEMDRDCTESDSVMMGAGVLGGVLGCVFCGPVMACVAGFGAAYGTTQDTPAGETARSMGRLALACRSKVVEIDQKHNVVHKTSQAACTCWKSSKSFAEEHKVAERTGSCLATSWKGLKQMNEDYRIVDRSWQGVTSAMNMVNDKVLGVSTGDDTVPSQPVVSITAAEPAGRVVADRGVAVRGEYSAVAQHGLDEKGDITK